MFTANFRCNFFACNLVEPDITRSNSMLYSKFAYSFSVTMVWNKIKGSCWYTSRLCSFLCITPKLLSDTNL